MVSRIKCSLSEWWSEYLDRLDAAGVITDDWDDIEAAWNYQQKEIDYYKELFLEIKEEVIELEALIKWHEDRFSA